MSEALQIIQPAAMIERAITSGASIEVLERLMALQERWQASQAKSAFDAAMADLRLNLPTITKNQTVDFSSNRGRTHYKYEDLADICDALSPAMAARGLSFRWRTQPGDPVTVACIISHRDGHREECALSAPRDESGNKNAIQGLGSAITYLQRYTLKAALGVAASIDDDGGQTSGTRQPPQQARQEQPARVYEIKSETSPALNMEKTRARAFDHLSVTFGAAQVLKFLGVAEIGAWPLADVPTSRPALDELTNKIAAWIRSTNDAASPEKKPNGEFTEPFWSAIITVPRAGTKRDDYLHAPDTIRSLYEALKAGDDKARLRLFGLAREWEPTDWTGNDGKIHPPSFAELDCRKALNQFLEWEDAKGKTK